MNTKIHNIAFVGGLLLGGCTLSEDHTDIEAMDGLEDLDDPSGPLENTADEIASENQTVPVSVGIIPPECIGAAVVGILDNPNGSCNMRSLPPGWIWRPMFEDGSPEVAALASPVPHEFQRYCMFEYVGQQDLKTLEDYGPILTAIENHPDMDLDSVAADCMGFKEQTTLNDSDLRKLLNESFLLNIDAIDSSDLAATLPYQSPVRVEVVDSVSQTAVDSGLTPHNVHGTFMSALIGNIACPNEGAACLDSIHHLLAMPRQDYQLPDWTVGEDYASKVDLAIQIYAAVQQWREDKQNHAPNTTDRLVINISLGYQRINQGVDDFDRGPQASLKTALDFAACHGALVFAASGNVRDENCPENDAGPLAPASFEMIAAPTEQECHQLGFDPDWTQDFPVFGNNPRPLVYAIGGVDPYDEPLANSRPASQPTLVALGANGVGNDSSMALTGTSISTAVASATAQLLWMYNPRLRPDEVYFAMYKSAWELNTPADFGLTPGVDTRRLSVCSALDYVCGDLNSPNTCPILNCDAHQPAADGNLAGFFSAVDDVLQDPSNTIREYDGHDAVPVCDSALPTELVTPQPEQPVCGHCGADILSGQNNDALFMSIDPAYQGAIQGAVLLIKNAFGNTTAITLDSNVVGSLNDPTVSVVKVNFNAPLYTKSATLSFTFAAVSQSNPVTLRFY
jgi:hypothetical protein